MIDPMIDARTTRKQALGDSPAFGSVTARFIVSAAIGFVTIFAIASIVCGQDPPVSTPEVQDSGAVESENVVPQTSTPAPTETTMIDVEVDESKEAAWEYRPYEVLVWVVHDQGAWIEANENRLYDQIVSHLQIADPTGWKVRVERAPRPWLGRLRTAREFSAWTDELILAARTVAGSRLDKLVLVQLAPRYGLINCNVRELDIKTRTWGARIEQTCAPDHVDHVVSNGIGKAFMPITRIDNIQENRVLVRVRANGITWVADENELGESVMVPNTGAPSWVDENEILLPVVLRKDRVGNVSDITAIDFTYLSINERVDPHLVCDTHSMRRAPLGGRSGGRTERMALCVRAPFRETVLTLVSNDKTPLPLRDLEVYSRLPGQTKDEESEFLGKTDWQGQITAPPNDAGFRILLVKSGERPLAKVPVVPGLFPEQTITMPNDEQRLFAEGIVKGYRNEINDLVARRLILETLIVSNLRKSEIGKAEELLNELRRVDDNRRFNNRISLEEKNLLNADDRQKGYIVGMFDELELASNKYLNTLSVTLFSRVLRDLQNGTPVDFDELEKQLRGEAVEGEEPASQAVSTDDPSGDEPGQ